MGGVWAVFDMQIFLEIMASDWPEMRYGRYMTSGSVLILFQLCGGAEFDVMCILKQNVLAILLDNSLDFVLLRLSRS